MKAFFRNMLQAYRGKCDGLVYYYNPRCNRVVVRPHVKPRPTDQTRRFGAVAGNLKALAPSEGFRGDLRAYVEAFNRRSGAHRDPLLNWYNAYMKLMYALASRWVAAPGGGLLPLEDFPEGTPLDLATLTRGMIAEYDLPCVSVKRSVEAGLLPAVRGYQELTREM